MTTKTFVKWGKQRFCVEVSDGTESEPGVRVYEVDKSGVRDVTDDREVFVDPHEMIDHGFGQRDILLVHAYTNADEGSLNDEGVPVTLAVDACEVVLTNDGNGTLLANEGIETTEKKVC